MAVSVPGTSHAKTGQPCQDASHCRIVAPNILVAAVADGAGSAQRGAEGAQIASRMAVETLAEALVKNATELSGCAGGQRWQRLLLAAMHVAHGQIEATAAAHDRPARDYATTLLLFVATPNMIVATQIGDGAIVLRDRQGQLRSLTLPQNGEYANTTTFLVSPNAFSGVQHQVWRGPYAEIAAFTDGLQRLALSLPKGAPHEPFFTPLFDFAGRASDTVQAIKELGEFLRSPKVTGRADDDLTLMLARATQ